MIYISSLLGNRIKPTNERFGLWFLTENLNNNNLATDIGDVDYCKGEQRVENIKPITDVFCDNIMLVKITGSTDCEGDGKGIKVKKEMCGSYNSYLRGVFKKFSLARHGVVAKLPFPLENSSRPQSKGVLQIVEKDLHKIKEKYNNPVAIPYKIELANVKLEELLEDLPYILQQLEKEMYYLLDLDVTQDLAGVFNKEEMTNYLVNTFNFTRQGDKYEEGYNVIVDNDNTVGIDCLTWLNSNCRVKVYNKFICQITSPGVSKTLGNNIVNFIKCPDVRLKETFTSHLAKLNGITRLEATIYNYSGGYGQDFDPLRDCLTLLENNKSYLKHAPFYAVPLSTMWTKLVDTLQNSCCLVFNETLQYVYWGNTNTKKLTGIQLSLPQDANKREKVIKYVLSALSFNCLPINYVEIVEDKVNPDKITVSHKCYIKSGKTYFTKSNTAFSSIPKPIDLQELGLVETPNITPDVLRSRLSINSNLYPHTITEISPLTKPLLLCTKKRKLELEDLNAKRRKLEFLESTVAIKEQYKTQLAKEQNIRVTEDALKEHFLERWKDLDTSGAYKVYAFVVNNNNRFTYVGALAETTDKDKSVYYIKGLCKCLFIELNKNRQDFCVLPYKTRNSQLNLDIVYLPTKEPIATFNTNGSTTYNGNSFPKIENLHFYNDMWNNKDTLMYKQEDVETVNAAIMEEINGTVKIKDCSRLEELEEGSELLITALKKAEHRDKTRYILKLNNFQNLYVSNYWLETELENGDVDINYKIKIKLDKIKTTPTKNKERVVFCV